MAGSFGITRGADDIGLSGAAFLPIYRSADGWSNEATIAAGAEDFERARDLADRAIVASPLDQPAVRTSAEIELLAGDDQAAQRKFRLAGLLGWRDMLSQARIMMLDAAQGDLDATLDRLNAFQRRSGVAAETQQVAVLMLAEEATSGAFLDLLERDPPWRAEMFGSSEMLDANGAERFAFALQSLAGRGAAPRASEIAPVLNRMAELGENETLARYAPLLGPGAGEGVGDGQFLNLEQTIADTEGSASPFAWRRGNAKRTTVNAASGDGVDGNILFVLTRSRVPAAIVSQRMVLAPGTYRLAYKVRGDTSGLEWMVLCGDAPVAESAADEGSSREWRTRTVAFEVPAAGCAAQELVLRSQRNLRGNSIEGEFADLSLSRAG